MDSTDTSHFNNVSYQHYFQQALPYETYRQNLEQEAGHPSNGPYTNYVPQNLQRIHRIEKTLHLPEDLVLKLKNLTEKIHWLVISEHWCGDAAQIMPVINALAQASEGKIALKVIYRDENPDLMDAHLTGTSRSIPKLLQLNTHFDLTAEWGPRPAEAQQLVKDWHQNPEKIGNYADELHLWYAKDKQKSILKELSQFLFA